MTGWVINEIHLVIDSYELGNFSPKWTYLLCQIPTIAVSWLNMHLHWHTLKRQPSHYHGFASLLLVRSTIAQNKVK